MKLYVWKCDTQLHTRARQLDGGMDDTHRNVNESGAELVNILMEPAQHIFVAVRKIIYYFALCMRKHTEQSVLYYMVSGL